MRSSCSTTSPQEESLLDLQGSSLPQDSLNNSSPVRGDPRPPSSPIILAAEPGVGVEELVGNTSSIENGLTGEENPPDPEQQDSSLGSSDGSYDDRVDKEEPRASPDVEDSRVVSGDEDEDPRVVSGDEGEGPRIVSDDEGEERAASGGAERAQDPQASPGVGDSTPVNSNVGLAAGSGKVEHRAWFFNLAGATISATISLDKDTVPTVRDWRAVLATSHFLAPSRRWVIIFDGEEILSGDAEGLDAGPVVERELHAVMRHLPRLVDDDEMFGHSLTQEEKNDKFLMLRYIEQKPLNFGKLVEAFRTDREFIEAALEAQMAFEIARRDCPQRIAPQWAMHCYPLGFPRPTGTQISNALKNCGTGIIFFRVRLEPMRPGSWIGTVCDWNRVRLEPCGLEPCAIGTDAIRRK